MVDVEQARKEFPTLRDVVYLSASTGPLPQCARNVLGAFRQERHYDRDEQLRSDSVRVQARRLLGEIVGAEPDCVVLTEGTSEGINILAGGLPLGSGDNVVLKDIEHPAGLYPWVYQEHLGRVKVRRAPSAHGQGGTQALLDAIDRRTRAVILSHVEYATGMRNDVASFTKACHKRGALVCIDACQSVGAVPVDVAEWGVDMLVAGCYKRLYGPKGTGFAYLRPGLLDRLVPPAATAGNVSELEEENIVRYKTHGLAPSVGVEPFARDETLLESKGLSTMLLAALNASLQFLKTVGFREIEERVDSLVERLLHGLARHGIEAISPTRQEERSEIVIVRVPMDLGHPRGVSDLEKRLRQAGIVAEIRAGGLRLGIHFFNTTEDVDAAVGFVGSLNV